jgi:hypothetical protein
VEVAPAVAMMAGAFVRGRFVHVAGTSFMTIGALLFCLGGEPDSPALPRSAAAELSSEEAARWSFTIEPFLWLAGIEGEGGDGSAPPVDVGENVSLFGEIDGGFLLALEARAPGGRYSVLADGLYLSLADDEGSLQTDTEVWMAELGAGLPLGDQIWEVIAGLRYVDLEFGTELGGLSTDSREDWIDPWVGGRGALTFGERWTLGGRADVGGFGVGTELTWQALAGLGLDLGKSVRLDLGYRAIHLDYDDGDLEYDALIRGPLIALAIRL